jgi:hypothetical protein
LQPIPHDFLEWLERGRDALVAEAERQNARPLDQASLASAKQRLHDLSTSSDRVGVSFAGCALHAVYFQSKFVLRASLLYRFLRAAREQLPAVAAVLDSQLRVASLGGGPGTDVAGLCWVLRERRAAPCDVVLYDCERSWRNYLRALQTLMAPKLALTFDTCDVRLGAPPPLAGNGDAPYAAEDVNRRFFGFASRCSLFVFSFVSHETATAASAQDYAFYRALALAAARGEAHTVIFLFLDVRGYAAPVFDAIEAAMHAALEDVAASLARLAIASSDGALEPLAADWMLLCLTQGGTSD